MKTSRMCLVTVALLAFGALVPVVVTSNSLVSLLTQALINAVFAVGVGLLLKQNGMVTFGHALYFGGAGYAIGILVQTKAMPAEVAILGALAVMTVLAFVIGLIVVRVPGIAFGMLTLAIGQMAYLTANRARGMTGGADGMNIDWPATLFGIPQAVLFKPQTMFILSWSTLVVVLFLLALLLRSRFGSITESVRDNEERARFIGITTVLPRAAVYALSALVAGIAGVLSAINTGFISPELLHWSLSGMILMMVVIGGFKVLWGPPLGAVVYFLFKDVLGDHATHWMSIFGVVLIAVIVFSPTGIAGALARLVRRRGARAAALSPVAVEARP